MTQHLQLVISIRGGSKRFGGAYALDSVDFDVRAGEIHALLGENGAGKSTLAKVMAGAVQLSAGSLMIDGEEKHFRSPTDSLAAGVAMVYQETSLIPTMTVAQNLRLGREPFLGRPSAANAEAREALVRLNIDIAPDTLAEKLGPAQRQMVEIARAVHLNARVIIFDEPTQSLAPDERHKLFNLLTVLRQQGKAIVFITHALEEALTMSDRITVLRDGKRMVCGPAKLYDRATLVTLMVGRDVAAAEAQVASERSARPGDVVLEVEGVSPGGAGKGMSFTLRAGEVVGLAGLVGSGRTEVAKLIAGVSPRRRDAGTVRLKGKPVRFTTPGEAIAAGVVYVTEDRKANGLFLSMTTGDNIYLSALARRGWAGLYSRAERRRLSDHWRSRLNITGLDRSAPASVYSGGNQQKIVIAKALAQGPDVIFFDEPTRGVDVGAAPHIHRVVRRLADEGKAVVVISSYLPEILAVSDRILVAREGEIAVELERSQASEDRIMHAAAH